MKFLELMQALHKVKTQAEAGGLNKNQINNLEIVDLGIMNDIIRTEYRVELAKHKIDYYLLIKKK